MSSVGWGWAGGKANARTSTASPVVRVNRAERSHADVHVADS